MISLELRYNENLLYLWRWISSAKSLSVYISCLLNIWFNEFHDFRFLIISCLSEDTKLRLWNVLRWPQISFYDKLSVHISCLFFCWIRMNSTVSEYKLSECYFRRYKISSVKCYISWPESSPYKNVSVHISCLLNTVVVDYKQFQKIANKQVLITSLSVHIYW